MTTRRALRALSAPLLVAMLGVAACSEAPSPTSGQRAALTPVPGGATAQIGHATLTRLTSRAVMVGGSDATAAVRGVTADGAQYVLDPAAEGAAKLVPGSVMILAGVGLRTVVDVRTAPQGLVVDTVAADLTDAVQDGSLDFSGVADSAAARVVAFSDPSDCPGAHGLPALPGSQAEQPTQLQACGLPTPPPTARASPTPRPAAVGPSPVVAAVRPPAAGSSAGTSQFGPWTVTITYGHSGGSLTMNLNATREGASKATITASGSIANFAVAGSVQIRNCSADLDVTMSSITGSTHVEWTVNSTQGVFAANEKFHPEAVIDIPLGRVGAFPISVRVTTGVLAIPGLTGKGGHGSGSADATFDGTLSFKNAGGVLAPGHGLNVHPGKSSASLDTPGPSAFLAAVQFPRISLGIGLPGILTAFGFADVVTTTTGLFSGLVQTLAPCRGVTVSVAGDIAVGNEGAATGSTTVAQDHSDSFEPKTKPCQKVVEGGL